MDETGRVHCAHGVAGAAAGAHERHLSRVADRDGLMRRLRRIEGQVRGIHRMVEEGRYCVDILVQVAAVKAALDAVGVSLMDSHIRGCVHDAIAGGHGEEAVEELVDAIRQYLRQP